MFKREEDKKKKWVVRRFSSDENLENELNDLHANGYSIYEIYPDRSMIIGCLKEVNGPELLGGLVLNDNKPPEIIPAGSGASSFSDLISKLVSRTGDARDSTPEFKGEKTDTLFQGLRFILDAQGTSL